MPLGVACRPGTLASFFGAACGVGGPSFRCSLSVLLLSLTLKDANANGTDADAETIECVPSSNE